MKLSDYLSFKQTNPYKFAIANGLSVSTVWRATKGKTVRPAQAEKISVATGEMVSRMDLLYPKK